jgi:hypothetical protein
MGVAWNQGARYQAFGKCGVLKEILVENSNYHFTYGLKRRFLKEQLKEHCGEECQLREWRG